MQNMTSILAALKDNVFPTRLCKLTFKSEVHNFVALLLASANASFGVKYPRVFLGRLFSKSCTFLTCSCVIVAKC